MRLLFPTGRNRSLKSLLTHSKYFLTVISAALGKIEASFFLRSLARDFFQGETTLCGCKDSTHFWIPQNFSTSFQRKVFIHSYLSHRAIHSVAYSPGIGLIKGSAEEHEQVADFEHGIVLNCANNKRTQQMSVRSASYLEIGLRHRSNPTN